MTTMEKNFWVFLAGIAGIGLAVYDISIMSEAHADEPRCVNGFITKTVERICDPEQGIVCYMTHDNGHGIELLSCVEPRSTSRVATKTWQPW